MKLTYLSLPFVELTLPKASYNILVLWYYDCKGFVQCYSNKIKTLEGYTFPHSKQLFPALP